MEQKAWEGCQALCARDPISQDSTNRFVRCWVGDENIGQKRNHIEVELRHLILDEILLGVLTGNHRWARGRVRGLGVVLGHALTMDQLIHEGAQEHEHQGVEQQTQVGGDAVGGANPAAEQAAGQLERLWVSDQEKHNKGHNLLAPVNVHYVLFI